MKLHFTAWILTAVAWPGFGQPKPATVEVYVNDRDDSALLGTGRPITVHLVKDELVPLTVLMQAKRTATWLYGGIGVKLKWSSTGKDGVSMQFDSGLPEWFHPGALGYSMPYAQTGTRIHVLVDRLHLPVSKPLGGALLGHVLAHELAHVLEGFTHHSEAGVMKARWDNGDLEQMTRRPLSFSAADAAAIRSGLAKMLARSRGRSVNLAERQ